MIVDALYWIRSLFSLSRTIFFARTSIQVLTISACVGTSEYVFIHLQYYLSNASAQLSDQGWNQD